MKITTTKKVFEVEGTTSELHELLTTLRQQYQVVNHYTTPYNVRIECSEEYPEYGLTPDILDHIAYVLERQEENARDNSEALRVINVMRYN